MGNCAVYSLTYAKDVISQGDVERGMSLMMRAFEEYVRMKDLTENVNTTKMMCFKKRKTKVEYECKMYGETVDQVDDFTYLGFWLKAKE